jgi:D-aspartate ligase
VPCGSGRERLTPPGPCMSSDEVAAPPVVLLGGGYNSLSAARSLGRAGREVHLVVDGEEGVLTERSRFVRSCVRADPDGDTREQWLEHLLVGAPAGAVVIPCSDLALELIAHHRPALVSAGLRPAEADDALVLAMLDKVETYRRAAALGFDVPRTAVVSGPEDAGWAEDSSFPLAVKPRFSHRYARASSSPKAIVVKDRRELERALHWSQQRGLSMLLTEIVPGPDGHFCSYYGYVDADGRELLHLTKRKLRQYPVGFGTGTYHLTEWQPEVAELGRRLFRALGLVGLGNVEFKRDGRDGRLRLIECNLRLTAATELLRRAGVDLAEVVYQRALGRQVDEVVGFRSGMRQWLPLRDLLALRGYRAAGELTVASWSATLLHRQQLPVFDARDTGPSLARAAGLGRHLVHLAGTRTLGAPVDPSADEAPAVAGQVADDASGRHG